MSLIQFNIDEVQDLVVLPEGEHQVSILSAELYQKAGELVKQSIKLTFKALNEPNAQLINEFLSLPNNQDDETSRGFKERRIKSFCQCFQVDLSGGGIQLETLPGLTGFVILSVENDEKYGDSNRIKRYTPTPF